MSRTPSLKSLQAFRYAAEAMSFKKAAERLFVTPTAISQQIKTLEQDLGLVLFKRKVREVELTSEGQQLLGVVSKGFRTIEEGLEKLLDDPCPNRLVISALPSFASRFLIPRLSGFYEREPDINIHLLPTMNSERFEGSEVDLAIRFGDGQYPNLKSTLLLEDYVLPVCHASLINGLEPVTEQLEAMPVLADSSPDMSQQWLLFKAKTQLAFDEERSLFQVSDATMLIEALLAAQGLALVRYSLVYDLLEKGQLVCPLPVYMNSLYKFYLVAPEPYFRRPKVRRFDAWLREEVSEIEQSWSAFSKGNERAELRFLS